MSQPDPVAARHALACTLARAAGALALGFFADRAALVVESKDNPQDVVSRADREVEAMIRARLAEAFPDDAILGEEGGGNPGTTGFVWVIDPIDGTMPFLSGLPHWCVAIAVADAQGCVAAATFAPVPGDLYDARAGHGARLNGAPLAIDPALTLTGRMTAIGASHRTPAEHVGQVILALMEAGGIFYRNGSGALMLASVAAGRLAGYYEPHMNAWDCLGGFLIVVEAGGRVLPVPLAEMLARGGPALAAAPAAYADLARIAGH
ncbi:MAG: inositol monophosphatase [Paracoccaceae bacterium]|nr:MAG: inositol monophosphatase [Paracoccaceae bacterium]